jgi:hypothetical protein
VRGKMVTFTVAQFAENYGTSTLVILQRFAGLKQTGYAANIGRHTNNFNKYNYYIFYFEIRILVLIISINNDSTSTSSSS